MNKNSRVLVVIPAYNEEKNIQKVIEKTKEVVPAVDMLVIDDGSTDATAAIAQKAGAKVISLPFNLGYGAGLQTGFKYALEKGYQVLVQMDADGQHEPQYINNLLSTLEKSDVDVVIGSRFLGKGAYCTSLGRRIAISLFGKITSHIIGRRITDPTSGFQAMNRRVVEFFTSNLYPADYPDADVLILLHFAGFHITEIPVVMYPSLGKKSIHTGYKPLYYVFKMFLSINMILLQGKLKRRR